MSSQNPKPTLQGQRIKTRKRDEKEKYDPTAFRDAIVQGLKEADGNLDQVTKFLDKAGGQLDYRRYAEVLCDVLFAGGILAPGGSIVREPATEWCETETCVFGIDGDFKTQRTFYEVFYKLIRRYKYLEKTFEEEIKKLLLFLKFFSQEHKEKLATCIGICLANGLGNASCLNALFDDHLVKDGLAITFAGNTFKSWLQEKDLAHLTQVLRKAGLEGNLLNLLPLNKRNAEAFESHFNSVGLSEIAAFQRAKATSDIKKGMQKQLTQLLKDDVPVKDVTANVLDEVKKYEILPHEAVVMVWNSLMAQVELNKKDELAAEQTIKYLAGYHDLIKALASNPRAELTLLQRVQEYCYENQSLLKTFSKIVVLFYKTEVLSEDVILKWYNEAHSQKGKTVFLEQTKKFIEWLQNAEEESDEDAEEDED